MIPGFKYPRVTMTGQSYNGSVPRSTPLNVPMRNSAAEPNGISDASMLDHHDVTFTYKPHNNKMTVQQNYSQHSLRTEVDENYSQHSLRTEVDENYSQHSLRTEEDENYSQHSLRTEVDENYSQHSLRNEVDDEGRIYGVVLPETPAQLPIESPDQLLTTGNNSDFVEIAKEEIKTEEEDINEFMEAAHDTFLKISSKELTIKKASELLGRPYSFVYVRFQEFCDKVIGKVTDDIPKKKKSSTKKRGKKKGKKKKNWGSNKPRKDGKVFKCEECPGIFHTEYHIKSHSKVHAGETAETHECTVCGFLCAKLLQLMRHRIEVHEEALQCPHCDHTFTIIASYKVHVRGHTGKGPWVCKECDKGFFSKFHLECHSRKHTGERPFMCGYCERTFMTLQHLKTHQYVHTGRPESLKKFECEQCGRKYNSNNDLMEHMNTHTGARPYACDMCDARFNFKTGLERHKVTHSEVEPYKCNLCSAGFYQKKDFEQHKLVHTGIKAFKCDQCDYACSRKHTLEYHKYTHTGETPFKCNFYGCTAEYAKPGSLRHHKMQHGQPPKTCKVCHEKFPDLISLKRHMMIHTGEKLHQCDQCSKTFVEKSSLKRHMYSHLYKPPGTKTKQIRQARKNPPIKKPVQLQPGIPQKIWGSEYQVPVLPVVAENGHNTYVQSLATHAEDTSQHSQPSIHPFSAVSQYSNLVTQVNNSWPSAMDHDELRRRLLSSFK